MSVLILVACYGGPERRYMSPGYAAGHSFILRQWAAALAGTGCESDVCFVSHGGDEDYAAYLDTLRPSHIVLDRPNTGHQQGAWDEGWKAFPGYDHYIVMDDDYIPVLRHFDRVLAGLIAELDCDYLCQYLWIGKVPMMNGIMTRQCLEKMGTFPGAGRTGQAAADQAQADLGDLMRGLGLRMADMGDRFRLLIPGEGRHQDYDLYPDRDPLFVPSQWYEPMAQWYERHPAEVS